MRSGYKMQAGHRPGAQNVTPQASGFQMPGQMTKNHPWNLSKILNSRSGPKGSDSGGEGQGLRGTRGSSSSQVSSGAARCGTAARPQGATPAA